MKKKARQRASKAAKRGKSAGTARKPALRRAQTAPRRSSAPKEPGAGEAKSAARRLRLELAKARAEGDSTVPDELVNYEARSRTGKRLRVIPN